MRNEGNIDYISTRGFNPLPTNSIKNKGNFFVDKKTIRIGVLGDGVTGLAVRAKVEELAGFELVEPGEADILVPSPGIPPEQYPSTKAEIISEIEFAYRLFHRPDSSYKPKLIAVTGTNGKTTVTSLISHLVEIPYAGNIGVPLIEYVDNKKDSKWIVVELSSYQLEGTKYFNPEIAVILNITPDHLKRHKTMETYIKEKAKIFQNHTYQEVLIYNNDSKEIQSIIKNTNSKLIPYSIKNKKAKIPVHPNFVGIHNQANVLASLMVIEAVGFVREKALQRLLSFEPLEHRIEKVLVFKNRVFYNDSKATNPDSTIQAVLAFSEGIHLILCGFDKKLAMDGFISDMLKKVQSITVFGDIGERLFNISKKLNKNFPIYKVDNIYQSIETSFNNSKENEVILFSPGSSSFDQFKDFEDRGQIFKEGVREFVREKSV